MSYRRLLLAWLIALAVAFLPHAAGASAFPQAFRDGGSQDEEIPALKVFVQQVKNGQSSQVTGLYVAETFAFPVVQQPANQPAFVSSKSGVVTQFGMASSYGSLGFLAHNTLAGAEFFDVKIGQVIFVVYGDGHYLAYEVTEMRRYQAVKPSSPYSSFIDLSSGKKLSAQELFSQTYGLKGAVILQTCIAENGIDNWGRMFIIAQPYLSQPGK